MQAGGWKFVVVAAAVALAAVAGCATWRGGGQHKIDLPGRHKVVLDQLVIHSNFDLPSQHRLLQELNAQRVDLSSKLDLPISDETIHVYLFKDPQQYSDFIRQQYPRFPDRRAFFIETDTQLCVFAHWGDRVAEDLRHEVAHGYLHSVLSNIPLWLDEGLAEYFEPPRGTQGLNPPHVAELNRLAKEGNWRPDIRRLEQFRSPADMSQSDYAESWAWIHWLLATEPERRVVLQEYLSDLRRTGRAEDFSLYLRKLGGDPENELLQYVRWMEGRQ